jgi:hypothetical protein
MNLPFLYGYCTQSYSLTGSQWADKVAAAFDADADLCLRPRFRFRDGVALPVPEAALRRGEKCRRLARAHRRVAAIIRAAGPDWDRTADHVELDG